MSEEKTIKNEIKPNYFKEGNPGGPGRPKLTKEQKLIRKSDRNLIKEYEESLSEALPKLSPVLKKMAIGGDIQAIKELHEVVGVKAGKGNQTIIPVQINFQSDKEEFV